MNSLKTNQENMIKTHVIKRNGTKQTVSFDKVNIRIYNLSEGLEIDPTMISQQVISRIYDGVHTSELDELAGKICAGLETTNPDYGELAKRIIISNNHKNTSPSFSETMSLLYHNTKDGIQSPIISKELYELVMANKEKLNNIIDYQRDYNFDYFSFNTLEQAYLKKINGKTIERIQHALMRVSLGLHLNDLKSGLKSYELISQKYFIHATPTLYHAGTPLPQLISCFLLGIGDSINGIYKTITDTAKISKWAGGIGVHISNIRSNGSLIRGTNGVSTGIVPMLKVFNDTAKYVNQCFTPDTIVFSKTGMLRMDQVKPEDELITKDGTFKSVNKVFIRELKDPETLISYQSIGSAEGVKCTVQHQIYCLDNNKLNMIDTYHNTQAGTIKGIFKSAQELHLGDYIGYVMPTYAEKLEMYDHNHYYIYGCLLGHGKIEMSYDLTLNSLTKYFVSLDPSFIDHQCKLEEIKKILDAWNIKYTNFYENNKLVIYWKQFTTDATIKWEMLYAANGIKHLYPPFLHVPVENVRSILSGILDNTFSIKTTSQMLVHGLRYIFLRLGVLVGGQSVKALEKDKIYREFNQPEDKLYILSVPYDKILSGILDDKKTAFVYLDKIVELGYFRVEGVIYTQITSIETFTYQGKVYDFNMHRNHNYMTHGGLVHNSGKRPGAFAMYLEPHHPDILDFLELKLNNGAEEKRARDLFYAIWASDFFMERVENDAEWSLFDPDRCRGLNDVYGDEYKKLYLEYEEKGWATKKVKARTIWNMICDEQIETGIPYMLFKDSINRKSNQQHYGTIRSSNLCAEITLYSDTEEYACCVLASISLPAFVKDGTVDHNKLAEVAGVAIRNLDRIIDINYYPVPETEKSNKLHRPLGLGIQGLADLFMLLDLPFASPEAKELNRQIFESIYYGAVKESIQLAKEYGPYPTYQGSPMSQGKFQFDLWGVKPTARWNWEELRQEVLKHGVRNSTLIALMPTASTSNILGNNECFEAYTSNIYSRRTIAGDFTMVNKHLVNKLRKMGIWSPEIKDMIIACNGSIQTLEGIPDKIKEIFKTVWEIKQKDIVDMAIDRAPFVCQTQSMNFHFEEPTRKTLSSALFYAWKKGAKTGSYYIRSRPKTQAQQFTIDPELKKKAITLSAMATEPSEALMCSLKNPGACESCSG